MIRRGAIVLCTETGACLARILSKARLVVVRTSGLPDLGSGVRIREARPRAVRAETR